MTSSCWKKALQKKERELLIRNRIAEIFLTISGDKIYFELLQVILEAMKSPFGTIAYINEHGERVVPVLTKDIWKNCEVHNVEMVFPREKWSGIWGKCLLTQKTVSSNGPFKVPEGHVSITRALAVPIIHQEEVIGNFMVANKETVYGDEDKNILEAIADHTAPILHARLLNERHEKRNKRAEDLLRKSHGELEARVKERTAKLQEMNDELQNEVSERIKTTRQLLASEEDLKDSQRIARLGTWRLDFASEKVVWSEELYKMYGFDPAQPLPPYTEHRTLFTPESWEKLSASLTRAKETGAPYELELKTVKEDGCRGWMWVHGRAVKDEKGLIIGLRGVAQDITKRKQAEQQYHESLAMYQDLVETSQDLIWQCDENGRYIYLNPAWEEVFGYKIEEMLGRKFTDFQTPEQAEIDQKEFLRLMKGNAIKGYETIHIGKNNKPIHLVFNAKFLLDTGGNIAGTRGTAYDITHRYEAAQQLKKSEENYHNLFEKMLDGFALHEIICNYSGTPVDYRFLTVNPSFEKITGLKANDLIGRTVLQVLPGTEKHWINIYGKVALAGEPVFFENYSQELDRYFEVTAYQPAPHQFACIFRDITAARRAKKERKLNEQRLQSLLSLHEKKMLNEQDLLRYALEEAIRMTESECGYLHFVDDDEINISLNLWSQETLKICAAQKISHYPLENAGVWADCLRLRKSVVHNDYPNHPEKKGYPERHFPIKRHMSVPIFVDDKIVAIVGVGNKSEIYEEADTRQVLLFFASTWDIIKQKRLEAEKKKVEARLVQAHKMEAIGTLAGGIAHDFNNILGVILGYTELAKEDAPLGSRFASGLDQVLIAGNRAKDLVKQILAFSRQTEMERFPLQLQPIIKEAVKMLRASIPTTIDIQENIDLSCGLVLADPTQIHQILMNLCANANHAMEKSGGILKIELRRTDVGNDVLGANVPLKPGQYIELVVSDTGVGIGLDIIQKVFDPYFTTKELGKGTGMGLAIVHGIITEYGGAVTVESELQHGTTFHVYFPKAEKAELETVKKTEEIYSGKGNILFVDDEELLICLGKDMLERLGYDVTVRQSSLDALSTFQNDPYAFDVVITDQTMPGITGADLSRRILQIRPDIPIILCTGHSNLVDEVSAKSIGIKEFVMKPLAKGVIGNLLQKLLGPDKT